MVNNIDYVVYGDTDSCYVKVNDFCKQHLGEDVWNSKTDNEKIEIIKNLSDYVIEYVNKRTFEELQKGTYHSIVEDFPIVFNKEKIAKSGLFVAKKMYSVRCLWIEGEYVDKISVTGLTVTRGDSSEEIRYRLKDVMYRILRDEDENSIRDKVEQYKSELRNVTPEGIAANIGVNNLKKWESDGKAIKGTPWHVKGAINYHRLLKNLGIENKYERISDGLKAKVVYVKPNKWDIETVSFYRWPKEFNDVIQIDMNKMIDKFFIKKIEMLIEPTNKKSILSKSSDDALGLFFQ